jgi:hypothetical protein
VPAIYNQQASVPAITSSGSSHGGPLPRELSRPERPCPATTSLTSTTRSVSSKDGKNFPFLH